MDERESRAKREAIRREIKERIQREFDERRRDIKARIKEEKISVQEKRRKYHREVHEQKRILMDRAKEEFKARKRMLGLSVGDEEDFPSEPPPIPPEVEQAHEEQYSPADELARRDEYQPLPPDEAFVYEDKEDSDARDLLSPISASDALPLEMQPEADAAASRPPKQEIAFDKEEGRSLFYYILKLVVHPVQALDEFDEYLSTSGGILKIVLFYLVSLLPIVAFVTLGDEILARMPHGLLWRVVGANLFADSDILMILGRTFAGLLIYSATIAIVNYFVADDANFLTLTIYFAFVEAVTRIIIYSLVVVTVFAAVMAAIAPQVLMVVALLFVAFFIWRICLDIIVLMSAYGYDVITAILLSVGASYVEDLLRFILVRHVLGHVPGL